MTDDLQSAEVGDTRSSGRRRLSPLHEYARDVRPHLPAEVFQRAPHRLLWFPVHLSVIVTMAVVVVHTEPPWYVALLCAIVAGHSWGCLGLLAHETMHHAVVKSRIIEHLVAAVSFAPHCLSPTLWHAWHNQAHHGYTGHLLADPDVFGTLPVWRKNAYQRWLEAISPGSGTLGSAAFFFVFFTLQSLLVLLFHSERKGFYARISRAVVYGETAAMLAFWIGIAWLVGPWSFLFIYVVPTLAANVLVISYIATNHFLNPLTSANDPLANSLSVTAPRWIEALHLHFGYHVEHHIFPTMSARHARAVRDVLVRLYAERYLSLPHLRALQLLYTRPKLHQESTTLVNPRSMAVFGTLAPGDLTMPEIHAAAPANATAQA